MLKQEPKRILAVVTDLFFSVKLTEAAKRAGLALEFVKDANEVMDKAQSRPSTLLPPQAVAFPSGTSPPVAESLPYGCAPSPWVRGRGGR